MNAPSLEQLRFNMIEQQIRPWDVLDPQVLELRDGSSSAGPFTAISSTTATQITATAADRSTITRFLGLFVSNLNGANAFTGSDAATLTFTMTVP